MLQTQFPPHPRGEVPAGISPNVLFPTGLGAALLLPSPFPSSSPSCPACCPLSRPPPPTHSEIKASHPAPCLFWNLLSASPGAEPEAFCAPPGSQRMVDVARLGLEGACLLSGHSRPSVLSEKQTWPGGALCSGCLVRLGGRSLLPHLHLGTLVGAQWGLC